MIPSQSQASRTFRWPRWCSDKHVSLSGKHPIYLDNRGDLGTHGVFLLNSNGMDIKINNTAADGQYPEYNTLGGVPDFYFLAGPSPVRVHRVQTSSNISDVDRGYRSPSKTPRPLAKPP